MKNITLKFCLGMWDPNQIQDFNSYFRFMTTCNHLQFAGFDLTSMKFKK